MPKISVCIPTYNRAHTIMATVESVLKQSFQDFELLVCIDGSTDKTAQILYSYKDRRLKIYKNKKNIGYVATMHRLAGLSSTNWVQFLSDDDILYENFLECCWGAIVKKPDLGFVVTARDYIDSKGKLLHQVKRQYIASEDYSQGVKNCIFFPPTEMLGAFTMMSVPLLGGKYTEILPTTFPAHIFNKKTWFKVGGSDPELFFNHDSLLVSEIAAISTCAYIDMPLMSYRIHPNLSSQAGSSTEFVRQYFVFVDKFVEFLDSQKVKIPEVRQKMLKAFERGFFAWNGHLLRIASKGRNYQDQQGNVFGNLRLVFEKIPGAKLNIINLTMILLAFIVPGQVIREIGLFYFKHLKR